MNTSGRLPPVLFAEQAEFAFATIDLARVTNVDIKLESQHLSFSCQQGDIHYEMEIDLTEEIVPEESQKHIGERQIILALKKKVVGPWWHKLSPGKHQNISIDWDRWVDEDEPPAKGKDHFSDFDFSNFDFGGGAGGFDPSSFDPSAFGGADVDAEDSDDEDTLNDLKE